MYDISKEFFLEYGHSVWSQKLDKTLCSKDDYKCACRHLHGHSGKITIHLKSEVLNDGMVTDFKHLGFMKDFIDDNLDHKFIIDKNDPGFELKVGKNLKLEPVFMYDIVVGEKVCLSDFENEEEIDFYGSFFIVDFLPTSESLSKFIFDIVSINLSFLVSCVEWQETPKSVARYSL